MTDLAPVRRALISVSDKTDLIPFAKALASLGIELVSTGGTAKALEEAGVSVMTVESVTGFPEMMDGRVKTLHPRVHGAILARRDDPGHVNALEEHAIEPIDLVCVNLYPFERTIRQPEVTAKQAIEQIDIGGPSMLRSAAKNHDYVTVVTSSNQYDRLINELKSKDCHTTHTLREDFAAAAFSRTAEYDAAISAWMGHRSEARFPDVLRLSFIARQSLRYGENPHQRAMLYADPAPSGADLASAEQLRGKPLSYNNILDAGAAMELVQDLRDLDPDSTSVAVIKHTNPCGSAVRKDPAEAFSLAHSGDPMAAYGGIVAISCEVDDVVAKRMIEESRFLEVVIAKGFTPKAIELLGERWQNVRLLATGDLLRANRGEIMYRSIPGGLLAQEQDRAPVQPDEFRHTAGPAPTPEMLADAGMLSTVVKHLKSNAVCIGRGGALLGAGAGQMDRVASCRIAIEKAGDRLGSADGGPVVSASDAFFPFSDGPKLLIEAGVQCLIQPGGSKRDSDTFELCEEKGVTCLLTGVRHFRH
jgi:phosphoribosylaminoimidazolecarboxamide formyltransferase/IMP cyclohydrolase